VTLIDDHLAIERDVFRMLNPEEPAINAERHRTTTREAALAMLSRCAQEVESLAQLQFEAGTLAASTLAADMYCVGVLDTAADSIDVSIGGVGETDQLREEIIANVADDSALAYTLSKGRPVVVGDLEDEPRFHDASLLEQRARSGVVCPVSYANEQYSAIGVFAVDGRRFSKADVLFVQSIALLLGPTIAHHRAKQALADQTRFLASTIDSLESVILLLKNDGEIFRINRACRELGGFSLEELQQRSFWGAFLLPEEVRLVHAAMDRLRGGEPLARCETYLLTKRGERRRISWTFSKLAYESASKLSTIASGIDITEQHNALAKLDELETTIRNYESPSSKLDQSTANSLARRVAETQAALDAGKVDLRSHMRRAYPYIQAIAPYRGGNLPKFADFHEVRCRDISPRGFSFVTKEAPDFVNLVVTFGAPPAQMFLQARIIHVTPIVHEGRDMLNVGCAYVQKVELQ